MELPEYIDRVRQEKGITWGEMAEKLKDNPLGHRKRVKPMDARGVSDTVQRGKGMLIKTLYDICDAMDCDVKIEIVPRE